MLRISVAYLLRVCRYITHTQQSIVLVTSYRVTELQLLQSYKGVTRVTIVTVVTVTTVISVISAISIIQKKVS